MGQVIPTIRRHHVARALVVEGVLLTMNAAAPVERWPDVEVLMKSIVGSYRAV